MSDAVTLTTYMIHHVCDTIYKYNFLDSDILTFDDGLYSIYYFKNELKKITNEKIIFITPKLVNFKNSSNRNLLNSSKNMELHFKKNDNSGFLSIHEIEELLNKYNFKIGAHGYTHDIILHGFNRGAAINDWRFYKYPKLLNRNGLLNINSCLSAVGYYYKNNKLIKHSIQEYEDRVNLEIYNMMNWFKKYFDIPIYFAFPFNSFNDYLLTIISNNFQNIYLNDRIDISTIINGYYQL